jgi:hypothetical protein
MFVRLIPAAAAAAALTAAAFVLQPATADAVGANVHKPLQGFIRDFGSKHLIGYFDSANGACALTLVVAERVDPDLAPGTGTQVRVAVAPGASTLLDSGEGAQVAIGCGTNAETVTVTATGGA